jgi:predicted porin
MRNILLTSTAVICGATVVANAQIPSNPSQGQLIAPFGAGPATNNNNDAWGIANTTSGSTAAGQLSSIYPPNVIAVPAPGTIVIRLNGRVEVLATANFTSVDKGLNANGTPNGFKLNPVGIGSYFRLYPGFDGLAANGLRYGASVELRENFPPATTGTTNGGATGGNASPSGNSSGQTIFVRRAFAYLASDQAGLVRLGQGDGVIGLFDNCIFTSQCWDAGLGGLDAGASQETTPSGVSPPFVWLSQVGAEYGNSKIVYLSPQFFGFDFGVQYAPSEGNAFANASGATPIQSTNCNQAGPNCINVSSGNDPTRWLNQVGVGLRYQHSFGAVDFKTYGFYETSGKESLTTTAYVRPSPSASLTSLRYDNLSFYKAGVAVTAFNVTAAVDYIGGAVNGQLALRPTGGVPTNAVMSGLTYAKGPTTLAVTFGVIDTQGDARLTGVSQRHEYEFAFGGSYKLAPGIQLVGEYQYAHRHQGGFDFSQGAPGLNGRTRDAQFQGVTFATALSW